MTGVSWCIIRIPDFFTSPEKKEQLLTLLAEGDRYDKKKNLLVYQTEIVKTGWILVGVVSLDTLKMLEQQLLEVVLFMGALLFGAVDPAGDPVYPPSGGSHG